MFLTRRKREILDRALEPDGLLSMSQEEAAVTRETARARVAWRFLTKFAREQVKYLAAAAAAIWFFWEQIVKAISEALK